MKAMYTPPTRDNWFGRQSNDKGYLHENIRLLNLTKLEHLPVSDSQAAILGYACDAGVRRNSGRPGAAAGPAAFRKVLGKLPWPIKGPNLLWDAGDIECKGDELEATQALFSTEITNLLNRGIFPIAIGGGHDIAYAHYLGIRNHLKSNSILGIVNFDAHLDLRLSDPKGHSGSPFYQISKDCDQRKTAFHYACLGLREEANPKELWDRAKALEVVQVMRSDLNPQRANFALDTLKTFIDRVDALYVSIDLDGFSSAFAPGVSAPSPMGYYPEEIMPLLECLLKSGKLIAIDIAELNPEFDRDYQTATLAAALAHKILREVFK